MTATAELREATIDALGSGGDGIATVAGGRVFVPFTLPGDRVRVALAGRRGGGRVANVVARLAEGPGRVAPPCRHFGSCGGCALQHIESSRYLAWKREQVVLALARRGLDGVTVAAAAAVAAGGRRRASFVIARGGRGVMAGFHPRSSRAVVDVMQCPVVDPRLVTLLPGLRRLFAGLPGWRGTARAQALLTETGVDLAVGAPRELDPDERARLAAWAADLGLARLSWQAPGAAWAEPIVVLRAPRLSFSGVAVEPPVGAFVQPTAEGEAALVRLVREAAEGAARVADLYAGCGTFTFALARAARVLAVEGDAAMAEATRTAAARARLAGRVTVEARDLARRPLQGAELDGLDAVVFDPPRAGAREQAAMLAGSRVPTVIAVSCDPASFARDARILVDGGYRLERVVPVDQFLWSPHVELVASFRRRPSVSA